MNDLSVLCEFRDLIDHALIDGLTKGWIADIEVQFQSNLAEHGLILLEDQVPFEHLIPQSDTPTLTDQHQLQKPTINRQIFHTLPHANLRLLPMLQPLIGLLQLPLPYQVIGADLIGCDHFVHVVILQQFPEVLFGDAVF